MQRFLHQCSIHTSFYFPPNEFESEFGPIFKSNMEPALQGSVRVTIHGDWIIHADPHNIKNWCQSGISDLLFPKSYSRSTLSESSMLDLKRLYVLLYSSFIVNDIDINSTFHKYSSLTYHGLHFHTLRTPFVYATVFPTPSCCSDAKIRPVILHFLCFIHFIIMGRFTSMC